MTTTITTCDVCGAAGTPGMWETEVKKISVKCPPDGINGGLVEADLCRSCRSKLHKLVYAFMHGQKVAAKQIYEILEAQ